MVIVPICTPPLLWIEPDQLPSASTLAGPLLSPPPHAAASSARIANVHFTVRSFGQGLGSAVATAREAVAESAILALEEDLRLRRDGMLRGAADGIVEANTHIADEVHAVGQAGVSGARPRTIWFWKRWCDRVRCRCSSRPGQWRVDGAGRRHHGGIRLRPGLERRQAEPDLADVGVRVPRANGEAVPQRREAQTVAEPDVVAQPSMKPTPVSVSPAKPEIEAWMVPSPSPVVRKKRPVREG